MIFKHLFVSASADSKKDTLIYKCHQINQSFNKIDQIIIDHNNIGLPKVYNNILKEYKNKYDFIHFVHDDVFIYDDMDSLENIITSYNYDIIGVAGSGRIAIKHPALWHIMGKDRMYGAVEHRNNQIQNDFQPKQYTVVYGPTSGEVIILDGVYICVRTKNINEWKFNENFNFHHYDIASCIDAFKIGLKLGVLPIHIRHEPIIYDPTKNENWIQSNKKFLELYATK